MFIRIDGERSLLKWRRGSADGTGQGGLFLPFSNLDDSKLTQVGISLQAVASRPGIGFIMLIHPQQEGNVTAFPEGDDCPVLVIDANRAQARVSRCPDGFIVERWVGWVLPEFGQAVTQRGARIRGQSGNGIKTAPGNINPR